MIQEWSGKSIIREYGEETESLKDTLENCANNCFLAYVCSLTISKHQAAACCKDLDKLFF